MVIEWRNQWRDEMRAEGAARCTYEIEPGEGVVKLTVTHRSPVPDSGRTQAVSNGWPCILSNLESWLETGETFARTW